MRRSSSLRAARSFSLGRSASARPHNSSWLGGIFVPVENLLTGPHLHTRTLENVFVELLEIADAVRHSADVGVHADRHDALGLLPLRIQPVVVADAAGQPFLRRMSFHR